MHINYCNKVLTNSIFWWIISTMAMVWYLSPLLFNQGTFYVPIYDNLDSIVVSYKILAESGMIFSANDAIIPNMMNGLPRASYGGEFDVILWLYYFFESKTAFIINEIVIHLVAFLSMFIFLKRYIVKKEVYYQTLPVFVGALYFSFIPYWSGAGLTIASLPIVTYSLLNIKNNNYTKWDWLLLGILPLYTSFIFLYMFYIILAGIYLVWDTIKNHRFNKLFFLALFIMGVMFLLREYRLVYAMFLDSSFISHRIEFDLFFGQDLWESYRRVLVNFLLGHEPHAQALQNMYVLPVALIAMLISLFKRRLSLKESVAIWIIVLISFSIDFWTIILIHKYTIPSIFVFSLLVIYWIPRYKSLPLLVIFTIVLSIIAASFEYSGFKWVTNIFPIFDTLNVIRISFVNPFIFGLILTLSVVIIYRKIKFTAIMIIIFSLVQFSYSFKESYYQSETLKGYASFDDYYVSHLFDKMKKNIGNKIDNMKFVAYGFEPAILLFNEFHTVDGYSTNYPLDYKYKFRPVFSEFTSKSDIRLYDKWGSKVYIISIASEKDYYIKGLNLEVLRFDTNALCELNTTHMISPYNFLNPEVNHLSYVKNFLGNKDSWDIFLYRLECE